MGYCYECIFQELFYWYDCVKLPFRVCGKTVWIPEKKDVLNFFVWDIVFRDQQTPPRTQDRPMNQSTRHFLVSPSQEIRIFGCIVRYYPLGRATPPAPPPSASTSAFCQKSIVFLPGSFSQKARV
mmetsp:Transcript_30835/g.37556  ORF Transcript_30835/g.37556 Transcript_30835/m.37556 type:complete len:125 (+) Transcript_30835:23-397(+)